MCQIKQIMGMFDSQDDSDVILAIQIVDSKMEQGNDAFILELHRVLSEYDPTRFPIRDFFTLIKDTQAMVSDYCRVIK